MSGGDDDPVVLGGGGGAFAAVTEVSARGRSMDVAAATGTDVYGAFGRFVDGTAVDDLVDTVHPFPTLSEAFEFA